MKIHSLHKLEKQVEARVAAAFTPNPANREALKIAQAAYNIVAKEWDKIVGKCPLTLGTGKKCTCQVNHPELQERLHLAAAEVNKISYADYNDRMKLRAEYWKVAVSSYEARRKYLERL